MTKLHVRFAGWKITATLYSNGTIEITIEPP